MGKLSSTSKLRGIQLEDVLVKNHIILYILIKLNYSALKDGDSNFNLIVF